MDLLPPGGVDRFRKERTIKGGPFYWPPGPEWSLSLVKCPRPGLGKDPGNRGGLHEMDICRWALGVGLPEKVTSSGGRFHFDDDWEFYDTQVASFEFPGGKMLTWEGRSCNGNPFKDRGRGSMIHGTDGTILMDRNVYELYDRDNNLVKMVKERSRSATTNTVGIGGLDVLHMRNFANAIRKGDSLNSPVDEAHISTIAVSDDWRGRGLGELLLLNLLREAYDFSASLATLEVRRSNIVAQSLYRKYLFKLVGERKRYYQGREDALIMTVKPLDKTYRSFLRARESSLFRRLENDSLEAFSRSN